MQEINKNDYIVAALKIYIQITDTLLRAIVQGHNIQKLQRKELSMIHK